MRQWVLLPAQSIAVISTKFQGPGNQKPPTSQPPKPKERLYNGRPGYLDYQRKPDLPHRSHQHGPLWHPFGKMGLYWGGRNAPSSGCCGAVHQSPANPQDHPQDSSGTCQPITSERFYPGQAPLEMHGELLALFQWYPLVLDRTQEHPRQVPPDPRKVKTQEPLYQKQGKIPQAHRRLFEDTLDSCIWLCLVQKADSMFNTSLFCLQHPAGYPIVEDFRTLNKTVHPEPIRLI